MPVMVFVLAVLLGLSPCFGGDAWKAGVATAAITPEEPMWMSGYASRNHPAEGKVHDLKAKALVLEDPSGQRLAILTLDLVGIDRDLSLAIRNAVREKHGIGVERCGIFCSHTHSGPVIGENLMAMYTLDPEQHSRISRYTRATRDKAIALVGEAIGKLAPARLTYGSGTAGFAVNRRNNPEANVPALRAEGKLKGPFDHTAPVLAVRDNDDELVAVLFGYACHATVLDGYQWCGDYPGFAQEYLERGHPGATALFFAGCGGDQNPIPRRKLDLADKYGRELAESVDAVLNQTMTPVAGGIAATYSEVELPFASIPSREALEQTVKTSDRYEAGRAKALLEKISRAGSLSATYPYPIQAWRLGDGPTIVNLGGEVVVDYALRLKQELGGERVWVAAYANDVMAYIPSRRVLAEGGYEGGGAMVYYGQPSPWKPDVEELIVGRARDLVAKTAR